MSSYTVTITLTDNSDPNGANQFNYAPGYLVTHPGDSVKFHCNRAFKVKFLHGSPFGAITELSRSTPGDVGPATVASVSHQVYHYMVTAIGPDGIPYSDGNCPT